MQSFVLFSGQTEYLFEKLSQTRHKTALLIVVACRVRHNTSRAIPCPSGLRTSGGRVSIGAAVRG